MFYNWSLRGGQWQQFLHAIENEQEFIETLKEVESEVVDGELVEDGNAS